jgi:4-hydroxy-2-oxoheptanedioate aldolase
VGAWCTIANGLVAELLGTTGVDYVCLDAQHGELGPADLIGLLTALAAAPVTPVVRVSANSAGEIGRALDAGAGAVIVPLVNSAEEAAAAAAACRFPPAGVRSYGPVRAGALQGRLPEDLDRHVRCIPMIETVEGVAAAEAICAVEGVDGVYVGPADLAISMGLPLSEMGSPPHTAAIATVVEAARRAGVFAGKHCMSIADARAALDAGFTMVTAITDVSLLAAGAAVALQQLRAEGPAPA